MESQRLILFIALGLVIFMLANNWAAYQAAKYPQPIATAPAAAPADGQSTVPQADSVPGQPQPTGNVEAVPQIEQTPTTAESKAVQAVAGEQTIVVETDLMTVEIAPKGGVITRVALKQHPVSVDQKDVPTEIIKIAQPVAGPGQDIAVAQTGLVKLGGGREYPNHLTDYAVTQHEYTMSGDTPIEVPLTWRTDDGVSYTKVFTFQPDSYLIDIEHRVDNQSSDQWQGLQYAQFLRTNADDGSVGGLFGGVQSYKGAAIYTPANAYDKVDFDEIEEGEDLPSDDNGGIDTPSGWVSMLQHYFVSAFITGDQGQKEGDGYRLYSRFQPQQPLNYYYAGYRTTKPTVVEAGEQGVLRTQLYTGPKEQARLSKIEAEGLLLTVDFGLLTFLAQPLFWVLTTLHSFLGNWGWSIVFLTLLIKLAFYPLSAASYRSMARMKKLQPRLQTLKERYGDDRAKLQSEMMEMYKKEKINPLGGCLPIVVQIPVFIALYWTLLESVELRQAPFMLWIKDLSIMDPYYVLPVTMGATMFAQHFLNPQPLDAIQKNVMMAMPIVFTFFFLWFPAGLVLYWLVNNVLSIAQQWYVTRSINKAS